MIPKPGAAIRMLSQRLMAEVVPQLSSRYAMSDAAMTAMLLSALASEMDDGVERRLADGRAMQALVDRGREAGHLGDAGDDIPATPDSMAMSDVNAWHDALTRRLIFLHEQVERAGDASMDEAIWRYLGESATRHALPL